jgi:tRNA A58 N-methylase Trm61
MLTSTCLAIKKDENPFALKIDQETSLTTDKGVFNPTSIITLKPGDAIKLYLIDGKTINGLIKSTELLNNKIFKVFGDVLNEKDAGFGFVLTDDGIFAGALVYRDKKITYKVQYLESEKVYILVEDKSAKIGS